MSGGQVDQLTGQVRRQQLLLEQAIADIELLKGDTGATGSAGSQGDQGAQGDQGTQGIQGVKGDAADAPIQSVNGYTEEVTLDMDDLPQGLSHISGGYTSGIIDVAEDKPKLSFAQNFLYKAVLQTTAIQFGLLPADLAPRVQGATNIIPIHGDGSGVTFDPDFFYFDGGSEAEIPRFEEAVKFILVLQYHENDDAVQVSIKHPQWLQRASADPTLLSFEWDAIHPEEVQSGAEVIDFLTGPPFRTNGKKVLLPFDSDGSGVTWGPEFVDIRDGDAATLPDLTDTDKYRLEMQYDEGADQVWVKSWPMEPLLMLLDTPDVTQDVNRVAVTSLNWRNQARLKASTFSHDIVTNSAKLIVLKKGVYRFDLELEMENGVSLTPISVRGRWEKNSTTFVGTPTYSTTLHSATLRTEASIHNSIVIGLAANDWLRFRLDAAALVAVVTATLGCINVERIG